MEQLTEKRKVTQYIHSIKGGIYQCSFPSMETKVGLVQVYYPKMTFHFNNSPHAFGYFGESEKVTSFDITEFSKAYIEGSLKIQRPFPGEIKVTFDRLEGFGSITGFPSNGEIYFENCHRIQ